MHLPSSFNRFYRAVSQKFVVGMGINMKNYTITVNGTVYDVTVEVGTGNGSSVNIPKAPVKSAPAKKVTQPAGGEGTVKVNAPMPGKILDIKAKAGQSVKRGEVILILEAMKMENEVVAPEDGTIAGINVAVGDSVESGEVLATLN